MGWRGRVGSCTNNTQKSARQTKTPHRHPPERRREEGLTSRKANAKSRHFQSATSNRPVLGQPQVATRQSKTGEAWQTQAPGGSTMATDQAREAGGGEKKKVIPDERTPRQGVKDGNKRAKTGKLGGLRKGRTGYVPSMAVYVGSGTRVLRRSRGEEKYSHGHVASDLAKIEGDRLIECPAANEKRWGWPAVFLRCLGCWGVGWGGWGGGWGCFQKVLSIPQASAKGGKRG